MKPKFWRVQPKRGKAHLTRYVADSGSGNVAICGKDLPADQRRGSAKTIEMAHGDECQRCLLLAGFGELIKRRPRRHKTEDELRLAAFVKLSKKLGAWRIDGDLKRHAIEGVIQILKKPD